MLKIFICEFVCFFKMFFGVLLVFVCVGVLVIWLFGVLKDVGVIIFFSVFFWVLLIVEVLGVWLEDCRVCCLLLIGVWVFFVMVIMIVVFVMGWLF